MLAAALAARSDSIVSGGTNLRTLRSFQGIEIVMAAAAIERIVPP